MSWRHCGSREFHYVFRVKRTRRARDNIALEKIDHYVLYFMRALSSLRFACTR